MEDINRMDLLIKKAKIVAPGSKLDGKVRDIKIKDGIIDQIGRGLSSRAKSIEIKNLHVSIGWMDVGTQIGEPGFEHRETIRTVSHAAALGGFTALAPFPNTLPVIDNKADVEFLKKRFQNELVSVFPIAAVSTGAEGKELAELLDLSHAGAVAFSDGAHGIDRDKLLLLALQYLKSNDGLIIDNVTNKNITPGATINEGKISVMLGLTGLPVVAEQIRVFRNISLSEYTDSKCLLHNISSALSTSLIRKAKQKGSKIYASVPVLNLAYTEEENLNFDAHWKLMPPLRTGRDRNALIQALIHGTIDLVVSNHVPVEIEAKAREFPYAASGAIGLQTVFPVLMQAASDKLSIGEMIQILAYNPRKLLHIPIPSIEEGQHAELSLFLPDSPWTFKREIIASRATNTPLIGKRFASQVLGIFHKNRWTGYPL